MPSQPHASVVPPVPPPSGCPAHAVPLMGPRFHTDLEAVYRDMRHDHGPVVPVTLPGEVPAWLVIGYREMYQVTSDPALFPRDKRIWNQWERLPRDWPLRPMFGEEQPSIYSTVGEEHRRHRALVQNALERVSQLELRRHTEELSDRLVDGFCGHGTAELISAYAKPLPMLVLARLIGFPDSDGPELLTVLAAIADSGPDAIAAQRRVLEMVAGVFAAKRERPGADLASYMLAYQGDFTDDELVVDLQTVNAAGYLTTADWIGNTVRLMLTDDRFAAALAGGRNSVPDAMNEVLWEDTPTQILAGRWAARDTRLGGQHVGAGDLLLLGLAGANADPAAHVTPFAGDGRTAGADGLRNNNFAHFSFSHGEFACPFAAQEIAETVARTGVEVLLDRLPDIELSVSPATLARRPSPFLRGMTGLPTHFTPTPAHVRTLR